ncbi:hypothetical protein COU37_06040 [Candidatus Micrarchaeota archaeon CG10_big_fil_rev_8_21_14_0_10_45_29]|nr:MAG: hypothetical protein COU37_06040 [Candidatus Micrarchaeota archaeon CG10_big_fil_rev_8_21_14_0_10_45_29]
MNLLEILILGMRAYTSRLGAYVALSLLLSIAVIAGFGISLISLIADGLIALYAGEGGAWIQNPYAIGAIALSTLVGVLVFFVFLFAAAGAYVHSCARVAANEKFSALAYFDEMANGALKYFALFLIYTLVWAVPALLVLGAGVYLLQVNSLLAGAGAIAALIVAVVLQYPLWLVFAASAAGNGVISSIKNALKANFASPLASFVLFCILAAMLLAPAISAVLYPLYFLFVFAPFASVISAIYFEAAGGETVQKQMDAEKKISAGERAAGKKPAQKTHSKKHLKKKH